LSGLLDREGRHVGGNDFIASSGEVLGEDPDRAARLECMTEALAGQSMSAHRTRRGAPQR